MIEDEFKINCSRFALNVFAQLPLLVPALFLVVYKPSKRKRAVGDIFNAKRVVKNYLKKVPYTSSPLMKKSSPLMTVGVPRKI